MVQRIKRLTQIQEGHTSSKCPVKSLGDIELFTFELYAHYTRLYSFLRAYCLDCIVSVWQNRMSETEQFIPLDEINDEQGSSEQKKHEKVRSL